MKRIFSSQAICLNFKQSIYGPHDAAALRVQTAKNPGKHARFANT